MDITPILSGYFKLDGGAMFGIVPRSLWSRVHPPDENNLCTWAMRCLLIRTGDRVILVDTGIGDKQDEKFRRHFEPHGEMTLLSSLAEAGVAPEDITDVLLTHLHFDHVGGAVSRTQTDELVPTFPLATYWTEATHWAWALDPNPREQASFLPENILPLQQAGVLRFVDFPAGEVEVEWLPGIQLRKVYGHTEAMMLVILRQGGQRMIYCADLLPSTFHISLPWIMAYDLRPLSSLSEKTRLLQEAVEQGDWLLFEHDPHTCVATVKRNERGRIVLDQSSAVWPPSDFGR